MKALLVVDVQEGIFNKVMKVFNEESLLMNINKMIDSFIIHNEPIIFIRHNNNGMLKLGTKDWEVHHELHKGTDKDKVYFVNKDKSDIFRINEFSVLLENLKVNEIVVTGLVTHGCVKAACLSGLEKGYGVTLISDGHSSFNKKAKSLIEEWNVLFRENGINLFSASDYVRLMSL
jgi:nicotinamidase-related amidase